MTLNEAEKLKPGELIMFAHYESRERYFVGMTKAGRVVYEIGGDPCSARPEDIFLPEPVYEWRWVYVHASGELVLTSLYHTELEALRIRGLSIIQSIDITKRPRETK